MPITTQHSNARRGFVIVALGLMLTVLSAAGASSAVDNGSLGIRPSNESDFFHLSLAPGAAIEATAIVSNHGAQPITLQTYPVDASTNAQGDFAMAGYADKRSRVGVWVRLHTGSTITVPAGGESEIPFRLSVPKGTPPGDYLGGVIIQSTPVLGKATTTSGGTVVRLDVVQRQGVRIYLHVDGTAVKKVSPGPLTWTQTGTAATIALPMRNSGNTILHPTATVSVSGWFGLTRTLTFRTTDSVLPGARYVFTAVLTQAPFVTVGTAEARITSEAGITRVSSGVSAIPWLPLSAILIVVILIGLGVWRATVFVRRANRALAPRHRD